MNKLIATLFLIGYFLIHHTHGQDCEIANPSDNQDFSAARIAAILNYTAPVEIALKFHIVRMNNGSGGFNPNNLNLVVAAINSGFETSEIRAVNIGYDFINNTGFYNLDNTEYDGLFALNNTCNAIDVYLVKDINAGFVAGVADAVPSRAFALASSSATETSAPHELGHCLNLYHTHHDESALYDPNACEELIDGSNSLICGDYVQDTPADPNLSNKVNTNCVYTGNDTQNGIPYSPDPTNIMSYSRKSCRTNFTVGQSNRMFDVLFSEGFRDIIYPTLTGPTLLCTSDQGTYTLSNVPAGATVNWATSSNLSIVSGQGTDALTVSGSSNGAGWVRPTISGDCGEVELDSYALWVGEAALAYKGKEGPCFEPRMHYEAISGSNAYYAWVLTGQGLSLETTGNHAWVTGDLPVGTSRNFTLTVTTTENGCTVQKSKTGVYYQPTLCDCGYDEPSCGGSGGPPSPLSVFPNPTSDELAVDNAQGGEFEYRVYSNSNELLFSGVSAQGRARKSLKSLQPGIYYLVIAMADGTEHRRKVVRQ